MIFKKQLGGNMPTIQSEINKGLRNKDGSLKTAEQTVDEAVENQEKIEEVIEEAVEEVIEESNKEGDDGAERRTEES